MKWHVFYLIGFVSALIIFGFNTPLLPKFGINYTVSTSWSEFLTAFGTVSSVIVALAFGLWGETLKKLFYKSDLIIVNCHENLQKNGDGTSEGQTRLKIQNIGSSVAEDAIIYVNKIWDGGRLRKDFLPVPLSWTHSGNYKRDFSPKEVWYMDLARTSDINKQPIKPILVLAANGGAGVPTYQDLYEGVTTMEIKLSQKSGNSRDYSMMLLWKSGNPIVEMIHFTEIKNEDQISSTTKSS